MSAPARLLTLVIALFTPALYAADETGIILEPEQVADQWVVVGVIADGDTNGIAVVKNTTADKTYTVRIGDALPGATNFKIKSVQRRQVIISDASEEVVLGYAVASTENRNKRNLTTFAESYLNSFPDQALFSDEEGDFDTMDRRSGFSGLPMYMQDTGLANSDVEGDHNEEWQRQREKSARSFADMADRERRRIEAESMDFKKRAKRDTAAADDSWQTGTDAWGGADDESLDQEPAEWSNGDEEATDF